VTPSGASAYRFDQYGTADNPTVNLTRGTTYYFIINALTHPFWIKSISGPGTGNAYFSGVTNNGDDSGTITFTVPSGAPNTLYYNCENHSAMAGQFNITGV
jgi:hypothetical protein